ncbi:MAG: PQQ-binding-like beta-propeller repeat protein [Gemmatimonadetes bacterium]|jgi:hypothetical protein|nr:PQQ-binding-like beta-propeller repeat protein [Gemmatimonadota bacterium]MBT6149131.1 PQQ-binding-like beta-propeller repeat protein [Gemmatimonadota bacterium]MBT7863992.1 PQQ-binding-like beta-propeller repeat protein [Gemmatimonadota bacterium]
MMEEPQDTHPLMPGIRCAEINRSDWPRTLHDKQLTGFSPLNLGMSQAPAVWQEIDVPGEYRWIEDVETLAGPAFLVDDGRLCLYDVGDGQRRWSASVSGHLAYWGDLFGDGSVVALIRQANRLWVVDGSTGEVRWQQVADPPHVDLRVCVAQILPAATGRQVAVLEQYGDAGWLLSFEPDGSVREVWRRQVISNDVWPVRADHGCDIAFDLTPARPILWNVRHHRCQSFDARTGEPLGSLEYELDGGIRRNYGPWRIASGADGQRAIVVASEMVQTHVHGLHLHEDGTPELAWERYYGEVYVVPGVAVEFLGVEDVDGDGSEEIIYNVRDPEQEYRSFTRVRDVATGEIKYEFADQWCSGLVSSVGSADDSVLLIHPAPSGATPEQGPLQLVTLSAGDAKIRATFDHAGPWGTLGVPGIDGAEMLLRVVDGQSTAIVRLDGTTLEEVDRAASGAAMCGSIGAGVRCGDELVIANPEGAFGWPAGEACRFELTGGAPPTMSAAAMGTAGTSIAGMTTAAPPAAELFAHVPGDRVWRLSLSIGCLETVADEPFLGDTSRHSPLLYDLDGDGELELVIPGASPRGELTVRAQRADGTDLWDVVLAGARTDDDGKAVAWNAGHFLAGCQAAGDQVSGKQGSRAAVAITIYSSRRVQEGTFLLDGSDGRILWFRGIYHDGDVIRAYRPVGIPGVFDWDGDGVEEIAWDMYSYMAFLRGDAEFSAIYGGPNVRPENEAVPAISLYNGFTPIFRADEARPHWFIHHGHGRFGLVGPDPRKGLWFEDVGYDTPDRIGFVDVDGDGVMEVGYALRNDREFRCRDLWSGDTKWTIDLPSPPNGPVLTADVDGDGRGEFLVDRWCIGTDQDGMGEIRWTSPVPFGWAVIADIDGDGLGEIACSNSGRITVLKSTGGPETGRER